MGASFDIKVVVSVVMPFITFALGLLSLGVAWLIRTVYQSRRDLDTAFNKIRDLEDDIYGSN